MKKILFLYNTHASWALQDKDILSKMSVLTEVFVTKKEALNIFKVFFYVIKTDIIFCWFGSFNYFTYLILGKILRKRIYIVAGGFDVALDIDLKHGAFAAGKLSVFFRRFLFSLADKVLAVSDCTKNEAIKNAKVRQDKIETIYLGFETSNDSLKRWTDRANQVVMISNVSECKVRVKGADQLLKIAKYLPEYEFQLIGRIEDEFSKEYFVGCPKNLNVLGSLEFDGEEFNKVINDSKIAIQLSHYESFGAAIIDAAVRGCYPIVYSQFGLKEIIQDGLGTKVEYGDIEKLAMAIKKAMSIKSFGEELAHSYLSIYSKENRKNKLKELLGVK